MLFLEHLSETLTRSIHALDVNPKMIERARRGVYSNWSLRETPSNTQQRWFQESGHDFVLDPRVRACVTFEEHNLAVEHPTLFTTPYFDVVFCRNMLMYLRPELAAEVVARIARALLPGGYPRRAGGLRATSDAVRY